MPFKARYYDGKKAEPHDALVNLEADTLSIQAPSLPAPLAWDYKTVKIIERPEHGRPLNIANTAAPAARLVVSDSGVYDVLIKKIPRTNAPLVSISTSGKSLTFWSIAAVVMICIIYWAAPQLSEPLARHFPSSWRKTLGNYTVDALTSGKPVCNNSAGVKALDTLVVALAASADEHPQVMAEVVQDKDINAFAAPGGRIVVFSHLIDVANSPDELAGVLAHEMGHVIKRHPLQTLIRSLGLNLVIKVMFGGTDKTATTASIASQVFQLHYSRNFERQADEEATQILYNAGIDNRGFIRFFMRLQAEHKETDGKMFSYVSTHPPTEERIEAIERAPNVTTSTQILTTEEWKALKNICNSH